MKDKPSKGGAGLTEGKNLAAKGGLKGAGATK